MISALAPLPARGGFLARHSHSVDGLPSATRAGLAPSGFRERELPDRSRRAAPSERCNEKVINYFRAVRRARGAGDAILRTWKTIAFMAEGRPIDYRLGFFSSTTAATGTAAYRTEPWTTRRECAEDASRPRGNGGTRRCGSEDGKRSAGNDRAGASRRCSGFGVEANTHFFSSHLKDQCRLPCDAQNREQNRSGPVCTISML
jgi:hypothetical protein